MDILFLILFAAAVGAVIYFDMKDKKEDSKTLDNDIDFEDCSECPFCCGCDKCTLNEDKQEENFDQENEKNIRINYNDAYLGQESIYDKEEEYEYYTDNSEEFKYDLYEDETKENDWDLYAGYWNK